MNPSLFINNRSSFGCFYEKNFFSNFSSSLNINWGKLSSNNSRQNFQSTILSASIENIFYLKKIRSNQNKIIPFITLGLGKIVFRSYSDILDQNGKYYNYWDDGSIRDISQGDTMSSSGNRLSRDYEFETEVSNDSVNRSEEHTSELQSHHDHVCRLLLEKIQLCHHKILNNQFLH